MENLDITRLSSRGQIVIPQNVRDRLRLFEGEKFIVLGEGDTIILKKVEIPSFKGFEKLLEKTREFVKKKGIDQSTVTEAIHRTRGRF